MSIVYLCGHLHTLGGLVPQMYTIQNEGFAELELADWKDGRVLVKYRLNVKLTINCTAMFLYRFRLMAFDQGSFSFIDIRHGQWPIILVTYPRIPWLTIRNMETEEDQKENIKYIRYLSILIYYTIFNEIYSIHVSSYHNF